MPWKDQETRKAYERARGAVRTARIRTFKDVPCADCGGRFPAECMDFDHVMGEKLLGIATPGNRKFDTIMAEMEKCEVVCANCHRIRTTRRRSSTVLGNSKYRGVVNPR